ncbi:MAG: leucine-rich repeat domain-containing protein [Oscillospiraceae bacterium]|nr:leucine-rich repeat domain-containing protein [Oscillospiraceae bacterium]
MKKALFFISVIILLPLLSMSVCATQETSGTCGEGINWDYDASTNTLVISGKGDMPDYTLTTYDYSPWHKFDDDVRNVVIKNGVTSVGDYSFKFFKLLSNVSIPSTVKRIGSNAFYWCNSLCEIDIPEGVETIDMEAFGSCHNLVKVTFPQSLKVIEHEAFCGCRRLENVKLPSEMTKIGYLAFAHCPNIIKIEIPRGIKTIEEKCFYNCINLTTAVIPNTVKEIEEGAFLDSKISKITYKGTEKQWKKIEFDRDNEAVQYADIEYESKAFGWLVFIPIVLLLVVFVCIKKKAYTMTGILILVILAVLFVSKGGGTKNAAEHRKDGYLQCGLYYQELGKTTYEEKMGFLFKENGEFSDLNYENYSYFENWAKENSSGKYKVEKSDKENYDFKLELLYTESGDKVVFYGESVDSNDVVILSEYIPGGQPGEICFFGTYISESYCLDNGFTAQ